MDLSVCLTTYNHARYITQALDGVLSQEAPFDWEVLVGDDDSTDGTSEMVQEYAARHPHRIRAFLHKHPSGHVHNGPSGQRNFLNSLKNAKGRYVALLDGDDYWTSPHKLRKQVEFLENHPSYSGCFHNIAIRHEGDPERSGKSFSGPQPARFDIRDLASAGRNVIPTCSVMFRNGLFGEFPEWYEGFPFGDWALHFLNAEHGPFGYIDEVLGVYRVHQQGAWSGRGDADRMANAINGVEVLDRHFGHRYHREFSRTIYFWRVKLALNAVNRRRYPEAAALFARALYDSPRDFYGQATNILPRLVRKVAASGQAR